MPKRNQGVERRTARQKPTVERRAIELLQAAETMMDEALDESFPASDPPAWSAVAARIRHLKERGISHLGS